MMPPFFSRALLAGLTLALTPLAAAAQSGGAPVTQGPMTVERVQNGFLFVPDVNSRLHGVVGSVGIQIGAGG